MRDFSFKPTLTGQLVRLRPFRDNDVDVMHGAVADVETNRLDLAVDDLSTGACVGEVVLNDWDSDNRSCGFRILLMPASEA